jgi:tetratricopeptide (TPR) repeat protein
MQAVLEQKLKKEPENTLWLQLLGDLMQQNKMEKKAIEAYEEALRLSPIRADLANNLAWVLLTAKDRSLRDPRRALTLARSAAMLKENGYILDTLALALWANGFVEEAIEAEIKAARKDPEHRSYYQAQAEKFQTSTWEDS